MSTFDLSNVRRDTWSIVRSAGEIWRAAKKRKAFHEQRARHWKGKRDKTERSLKKHGIKIVPDLFNQQTISAMKYSGARHEKVSIDGDLLSQLNNENQKVEEHKKRARGYAKYVSFLGKMAHSDTLRLTILDAEYFGLVEESLEGEEYE